MIKILLVATVVSSFMVDEIGEVTDFDSSQISTVAVLMVEFAFVFGAHSWVISRLSKRQHGNMAALSPCVGV